MNLLAKERVSNVRKLSERIGETVTGIHEIHAHDAAQFELADFSERLGTIFDIRRRLFCKKFLMKFLNNFLAQLTPFFFFSIGGYLVILGNLSFGALVAVLAAYKDLQPLWKELLGYYQRLEDAKIKYGQLREQFMPADMLDVALLAPQEGLPEPLEGAVVASNLSLEEDEGAKVLGGVSLSIGVSEHVAVVGPGGSGKTELARLLARQLSPTGGQISIGDKKLATLPEAVTGHRVTYVDQEAYIRSGTIRDALLYGLKHYPVRPNAGGGQSEEDRRKKLDEAVSAGNSPFDIHDDWIDSDSIGAADDDALMDRMVAALAAVGLEDDVFQMGLRRVVDPLARPDFAEPVLEARTIVRRRLADPDLADLVEVFDKERFNTNASVAENILFGAPVGPTFAIETLGQAPYVNEILERTGLESDFLEMGRSIAALMVELFNDLPPGHEFFERFGFFDSEDLPAYQTILKHAASQGLDGIDEIDKARLSDLPFKLVPARHHLDMIDKDMQERILKARFAFAESLPAEALGAVEFFDAEAYNAANSIQDNILFGKVADAKVRSVARVGALLAEVVDGVGLRPAILDAGLDFDVGVAGKRLSAAQRQKLAIARSLLKRPQIMIVNEAAAAFDAATQATILAGVKKEIGDQGLIWVADDVANGKQFDQVLSMENGRLAGQAERGAAPEEADVAVEAEGAASGRSGSRPPPSGPASCRRAGLRRRPSPRPRAGP